MTSEGREHWAEIGCIPPALGTLGQTVDINLTAWTSQEAELRTLSEARTDWISDRDYVIVEKSNKYHGHGSNYLISIMGNCKSCKVFRFLFKV